MPDQPNQTATDRRLLMMLAKLAVSTALLVFLFSRSGVDATKLWADARRASMLWLLVALGIYTLNMMASAWRWHLLLQAQKVPVAHRTLFNSFLVATFFNNFLPSNIGGDVIRIRDTARAAGSRTLATTVVLLDRGLGLLGLVFVAALGASLAASRSEAVGPIGPGILWAVFVGGVA